MRENISKESKLITDQARHHLEVGRDFASHDAVNHGEEEYARYASVVATPEEPPYVITTNTVEGWRNKKIRQRP